MPLSGPLYIQRLAAYIHTNELSVTSSRIHLSFTLHHLYYLCERLQATGLAAVGPLNMKLENLHSAPTFVSFLDSHARGEHVFEDSDITSVTSISSVKSIVTSASKYWRLYGYSKDPRVVTRELEYLGQLLQRLPTLILLRTTKVHAIADYEEYPFDTAVPLQLFAHLRLLELREYEPNEVYGWNHLSEGLETLVITHSKLEELADVLYTLVVDDEDGRTGFFGTPKLRTSSSPERRHLGSLPERRHRRQYSDTQLLHPLQGALQGVLQGLQSVRLARVEALLLPLSLAAYWTSANYTYHAKRGAGHPVPPARHGHQSMSAAAPRREPSREPPPPPALAPAKWLRLVQLTVTHSALSCVLPSCLRPLANLVRLNLSHNRLATIPVGLRHAVSLEVLNLSHNHIATCDQLYEITRTGLQRLTTLNLASNRLVSLKSLAALASLERLDVRDNLLGSPERADRVFRRGAGAPDLAALRPLARAFKVNGRKLKQVNLARNPGLHRAYRVDVFNLYEGCGPPAHDLSVDGSRPGFFEGSLLLNHAACVAMVERLLDLADELSRGLHLLTLSAAPSALRPSPIIISSTKKLASTAVTAAVLVPNMNTPNQVHMTPTFLPLCPSRTTPDHVRSSRSEMFLHELLGQSGDQPNAAA